MTIETGTPGGGAPAASGARRRRPRAKRTATMSAAAACATANGDGRPIGGAGSGRGGGGARRPDGAPTEQAATASSSQRSLSATPAWPLTLCQVIVWRATSASSSSHRSWFLTGCLAAVFQPRATQPTCQRLTIASMT